MTLSTRWTRRPQCPMSLPEDISINAFIPPLVLTISSELFIIPTLAFYFRRLMFSIPISKGLRLLEKRKPVIKIRLLNHPKAKSGCLFPIKKIFHLSIGFRCSTRFWNIILHIQRSSSLKYGISKRVLSKKLKPLRS